MTRFTFLEDGRWSGGGRGYLELARFAAQRHEVLNGGPDGIQILPRNVPARGQRLRRPFVVTPQNAWPWASEGAHPRELARVWGLRAASDLVLRAAAGVLRISSAIPVAGRPDRYSPVIPNVLDPGFEAALEASYDVDARAIEGRILTIGSCYSYRNLERLIEAHRLSGDPRELLIAGPVGSPAVARRVATAALDAPRVRIRWATLARPTCLAWLRAADLVVLPSMVEASPFSALEAFAVQPNVLASDIPGHREVLAGYAPDGDRVFVDPTSVEAWAKALGRGGAGRTHDELRDADQRAERRIRWARDVASWCTETAERLALTPQPARERTRSRE